MAASSPPSAFAAAPAPAPAAPPCFTLSRGLFTAAKGRCLPWQACRPETILSASHSPKAQGKKRGTVIVLNDWGAPFAENTALLAALAQRGFMSVGYSWYLQAGKKTAFSGRAKESGRYACRFNQAALAAFLHTVILPDYPAPFYLLAQGAGALFALSAQNILSSVARRMVLAAPPFSISGHKPHSLYHFGAKAFSLFCPASARQKAAAQASCAYQANLLSHAAFVLSARFSDAANLPCLIIIAADDSKANRDAARRLAENLRLADTISVAGAADFLCGKNAPAGEKQFWAAFDAFIPGSDAACANAMLEHAALL